ncbi:glycosyltransferase [Spirosoma litoris]
MNLLHVIGSMSTVTGGPGQGIRNMSIELKKLNVYEEILCLDNPNSLDNNDSLLINAIGPSQGSWQYNAKLLPWLIENLPRFDVVVLNGIWIYISYSLWRAINYLRSNNYQYIPKFFIMPHGMLDPWFQKSSNRRFKALRNSIYWMLIEHRVIRDADALLFTSETELLLARKPFYPYKPKNEIVIGYGIQEPPQCTLDMLTTFKNSIINIADDKYILFFSRIHEKKGVDLLIKAYIRLWNAQNLIARRIPKLVIVGPGLDSMYGRTLQKLVSDFPGAKDDIVFSDMITGEKKWGAIYGCEAFILPSYQENFGIAVVEAMACKKAVLISNQVNIHDKIKANNAGIVFENSVEEIRIALEKWLNLSDIDQQLMYNQAYTTYKNYFSMAPVAERFLSTINS